jgi:tRNA (mo5U34)-methyltransferase
MRVLDVATYNGFWAFELEKRGADEVVAIDIACAADIDLAPRRRAEMSEQELRQPTGAGFEVAAQALGSKVDRRICNVYDLGPERVGMFDFVFCGDLLLHITNPIRALQNIRSVTKPTGCAMICEMVDPVMRSSGPYMPLNYRGGMHDFTWWTFGQATLEQMIGDAGFDKVETLDRFILQPRGYEMGVPHVTWRASEPLS